MLAAPRWWRHLGRAVARRRGTWLVGKSAVGQFGDWGAATGGGQGDTQQPTTSYVTQWLEAVERDYSHPSIVGWCPLNETHQLLHDRITALDDVTRAMFLATKAADTSRPVIDASGYSHRVPETDVFDSHLYEQDPRAFAQQLSGLPEGRPYVNTLPGGRPMSLPYRGQPYFCSEFGGTWWDLTRHDRLPATTTGGRGAMGDVPQTRRSSTSASPA